MNEEMLGQVPSPVVNQEANTEAVGTISDEYLEENEFPLPVGYIDGEGRLHKTIKLVPMTGETEEAISNPKIRDNGGKMVTELITGVTERLGAIKNVSRDIIRQLTIVDRDFILLKNRQVSIGDEVNYQDVCPSCRGKNDIFLDLKSVEVQYLDKDGKRDMTFELYNGVRNSNGQYCKTITIQMPNGFVQERVAPIARINPAQATTAMLQAVTKRIEGIDFLNPEVFRKMTKKDRDLILKKANEFEAKVELVAKVVCADCGAEFTSPIPIINLLGE